MLPVHVSVYVLLSLCIYTSLSLCVNVFPFLFEFTISESLLVLSMFETRVFLFLFTLCLGNPSVFSECVFFLSLFFYVSIWLALFLPVCVHIYLFHYLFCILCMYFSLCHLLISLQFSEHSQNLLYIGLLSIGQDFMTSFFLCEN